MESALGFLMWGTLFGLAWWAKRWSIRVGARSSTPRVSGNGVKWEQDKPLPECFDEMEDDL